MAPPFPAAHCTDCSNRDPDPGPNYAMFMEEYAQQIEDDLPTRITTIEEPELEQDLHNFEVRQKGRLQGVQMVKDAYLFYERFKGLIVDFDYGFRDRNKSLQYFLSLEEEDAIMVVETELSFIYDTFYTKAIVLHRRSAYVLRGFCLISGLISLGFFFVWEKVKHGATELHVDHRHIKISYTLILGAIALDAISLIVQIFSNWSVAFLVKDYKANDHNFFRRDCNFIDKLLAFKTRWLSPYPEAPATSQLLFLPWSKSVSRFSLLNYYLHQRPPNMNKILDSLGLRLLVDGLMYVEPYRFNENMKKINLTRAQEEVGKSG